MVVYIVTVHVKPAHLDDFKAAALKNHAGTRAEPGNLRFDVLQADDDPCRFVLYEVFASPAAVEAHRKTEHFLAWRAAVEPWMAKPREGKTHTPVAPEDPDAW